MRNAAFPAILMLLAGCLQSNGGQETPSEPNDADVAFQPFVPPAPDFDFSTVVDPDHAAHHAASLHTAGHGLTLVGHAGLGDLLPPTMQGSISAIDVWGDYAVVAGLQGGLGFAIVDLADPANPKAIGWAHSMADGFTARFSDDGQYVFYGCQMSTFAPSLVQGTCEDPEALHAPVAGDPAGVSVWDVSDKTDPKFVTFTPAGSHNIYTRNIGGTDYVFTENVEILAFDRGAGVLTEVAALPGRHDVTVEKHPITGDWLLLTGTGELAVYNVNDPTAPELIFEGTGSEGWEGWHDQVLVPGLVDGRVILLLAGESLTGVGGETLSDAVDVVDLTDPADPVLVGSWQPPFRPLTPWGQYTFSVHEMAATPTGQVAIAWYHAGVWVIDVSTQQRQTGPVTLAAYQPHEASDILPSTPAEAPLPWVPNVWGAGWSAAGHLVVPDMHTGVYVLEPEWGLHPALDSGQ